MLKTALSFLILVFITGQLAAARVSLQNLDNLEDIAIQDRLTRILTHQYTLWAQCPKPSQETVHSQWSWYQLIQQSKNTFSAPQEQKKYILNVIEAIQQTANPPADCFKAQNARVVESVRKNIVMPPTIKRDIYKFYKELAPACFPVAGKGEFKNKDTNACFGADTMIVMDADKLSVQLPYDSLIYAAALLKEIQNLEPGQSFDLFNVYAKTFTPDPKAFFTTLASFSTSGNSGLTGWLQGVEDTLLVRDLNSSLPKEKIYDRAKKLQLAKITYQKVRDLGDRWQGSIRLFGLPFDQWNRHNVMAAYLGCREEGSEAEVVARVGRIGIGYESKDFVSHILEGVSLEASTQNFKADTHRYTEGATLGYQACHRN